MPAAEGADAATLLHVVTVPESLVFLRGQARYMRRIGVRSVVATGPGPALDAYAEAEGVRAYPVPMARRITPVADLRSVVGLVRAMRRECPEIVHAHTPKGGLLGMIAATVAGVRARVYHMRGFPAATATGWRRALLLTTERVACGLAHRVLCVSPSLRDAAVAAGVCPPGKLQVLGRGSGQGVDALGRFDPDRSRVAGAELRHRLGIPHEAPVVGFVGRLGRDKGVTELADAWSRLRVTITDAHLLLIGPVDARDPVPDFVLRAFEADPRVHRLGPVAAVEHCYAAMQVVVLPSYREGFPNVLLEAAAMALPCVATRVAGCLDAVADGRTGVLVGAGDAAALHDALAGVLRDPSRARALGRAGRAMILADFQRESVFAHLAAFYVEMLGPRGDTRAHAGAALGAPPSASAHAPIP